MDVKSLLQNIDTQTARAFVTAAGRIFDAMLIEAERVQQTQTPAPRDYNNAVLPRTTPAGGWLATAELRNTAQRMSEAATAEQWLDGMLFAMRAMALLGVL